MVQMLQLTVHYKHLKSSRPKDLIVLRNKIAFIIKKFNESTASVADTLVYTSYLIATMEPFFMKFKFKSSFAEII